MPNREVVLRPVLESKAAGLKCQRDEDLAARPLQQYWAFGQVTGRLSKQGDPVKASVELPAETNSLCFADLRVGAEHRTETPQEEEER